MEASELIERLEKATGPDREIDAAIWYAFFRLPPSEALGDVSIPSVTRSLDAALALVERVLPGVFPAIAQWQHEWRVELRGSGVRFHGRAPTPALALCLALLKAVPNCPPQAVAESKFTITEAMIADAVKLAFVSATERDPVGSSQGET